MDLDAGEEAEGIHQAVHGATVFQVTHDTDGKVLDAPLSGPNGVEVEQRLGGMLILAVARVDDRHIADVGGPAGRSVARMAQHDGVAVGGKHLDGVVQALALGHRAAFSTGKAGFTAAQLMDRGQEAVARARTGFIK